MKQKTIYSFMLAVSCILLNGCSIDDTIVASNPNEIGWNVLVDNTVATRGDAVGSSNALANVSNFQVWGYDDTSDKLYMGVSSSTGRVVTNTGTALSPVWNYTPQQFWPVNPLNFVAATPAADGSLTSTSSSSASHIVTLTTNITVDTDVEDQKDVMFAHGDGITSSTNSGNVPLIFQHALSQVLFKGKIVGNGITKVSISEISLCNIKKTGILTFNSEGRFFGSTALSEVLKPASVSNPATFTLDASDLEASVWEIGTNAVKGAAFDLTASYSAGGKHNAWFMLPQSTEAWVGPAAIGASPSSGSYLKIRAQLEKDGIVLLGNAAADALYVPLDVEWDRGKKYVYTLEFNGDNTLNPIVVNLDIESTTDLSMVDNAGNERSSMTTANCYMVHKAGKYILPLVYGNAIKDGTTNSLAYQSNTAANSNKIDNLVNHADVGISDPWIKNNTTDGSTPIVVDGAELIWEDVRGLVSSVGIEDDYLTFSVPDNASTKAGNAVIAAKMGSTIVWSWHIWVTSETLASLTTINTGSHSYQVAPVNVGWIPGEGSGRNPYYQWGRKDAMYPSTGGFNSAGTLISTYSGTTLVTSTSATPGATIQHPDYWYYNDSNYGTYGTNSTYAGKYNYWDMNNTTTDNVSTATVKTVYDPCPPGFCVPTGNLYYYMGNTGGSSASYGVWDDIYKTRTWVYNSASLVFPASGYRDRSNGSLDFVGSLGGGWSSTPSNTDYGHGLYFISSGWYWSYYGRSDGYPVRPVAEE